ncbi:MULTISPECIES: phosphoglycerate dehydrogenase [Achromobacter]|uniref:Phosphoglycerate dehydrogenase n=1 Tax=Achromobacter spanius TaxID=217203 RepID=A0ABY8GV15_9BURK|nr:MULTISPECIES: phosphoglycerate dehydrogenase [Achromobacter]WAI82055.1 phosphoglycerate dehydrogenase [Achromobacter spanius]WEX92143.1 phosphoglycerate dehydrogenase [Achromobacter sp. SS2-2022]WFP08710.1 phosphoglycerate dehydrogenase [Achromobacter spanius]
MLRDAGISVRTGGIAHDGVDSVITESMHEALGQCSAWIMGIPPVSAALLERYPHLTVLSRRGVGYDTIDVAAVKQLGRVLTITPGSNESTVADQAVGLMLAVARRLFESHRRMQAGETGVLVGTELSGKTVGLVGLGRIARLVARRLRGFDVRLLAYDPYAEQSAAREAGVELKPLPQLLAESDFISLQTLLNDSTHHLINDLTISAMKSDAILVNTARGELVDDAALLGALKAGKLAGAGLDVLGSERNSSLDGVTRELLALPNVICTQHTGGSSREGLARANSLAAQCVIAALQGKPIPASCVVADARKP